MINKPIKSVLWVCFGNTSRSPLALGLALWLKDTLYKSELKEVNFDSAGFVNVFKTAQPETIEYLKTKNVDFSDFRGKLLTDELVKKQDLILVMEAYHLKRLRRKFKHIPNITEKSFILLDFAGYNDNIDIRDPVNFSSEVYENTIQLVEKGVIKSIEKIIKINQDGRDLT
jgi:protein-tyrosine-phosphatase